MLHVRTRIAMTMFLLAGVASVLPAQSLTGDPGLRLWIGYYGELGTHPGIAVGAQFTIISADWYELALGPVLGFYVHPRNHIGLFLDAEISNRFVLASGLYFSVAASVGYFHSLLSGDGVYGRAEDGSVSAIADWGRPYGKFGGSLGLGWDFAPSGGTAVSVFTRVDIFARYPFNDGILPQAAILAGAAVQTGANE